MTLKRTATASILVLAMALGGCTHRVLDFTIVSTKNIDLSKASTLTRSSQRTDGQDKIHIIIFIPTGSINLKEAVDRALAKVPGSVALLDGVIYQSSWWAILYGQSSFTVEGTALIDPTLVPKSGVKEIESNYISIYEDPDSMDTRVEYLTQADYESLQVAVRDGGLRAPGMPPTVQP
jgi:hypothetical protein